MTRQERVKRYMEILDEYDEGNSGWNWDILDKLSDKELFEEDAILKKITIIREHSDRLENPTNKYPESIMEDIRMRLGLEKYDTAKDDQINEMPKDVIFSMVCNWNGLLGYDSTIKTWIKDIYGIQLG
ncbi:hypothetical protein [Thomasclavelia cocleata]|uniref:hypothetical protein n=1 Tax=Thomasclavelia cocleata TaxID=69824 RepID=UPI00256F1FA0|nr:hypothetical protein [Thomasclavelia cocleata]